jgi:uncharacterized membrane-anchored protein YitT (DUF2179 family)
MSERKGTDRFASDRYRKAKLRYRFRKLALLHLKDAALMLIGILSAGFGLKSFLLPNKFIDGGATGISLLLTEITSLPLYLIIVLVNIPFIAIGFRQIGNAFAIKTSIAILGLAFCIALIDYPVVTTDKLLVAVFGGFFLGAGIGFAVRGGGVLDGTEVLAIFFSKKTSVTIGDVILIINIVIFSTAAILLGIDTALYSMLTYISASRTVDFIIEGIEEYTGVTIISIKSNEIGQMITSKLGRGITVYQGKGGFGKKGFQETNTNIIYTVVTRLEISRLKTELEIIDPEAFVVMNSIKDTKGGMIKKRALKH